MASFLMLKSSTSHVAYFLDIHACVHLAHVISYMPDSDMFCIPLKKFGIVIVFLGKVFSLFKKLFILFNAALK